MSHQTVLQPPAPKKEALPWLILVGLSLVWGSSFILIKKGVSVFSPLELACFRVFSASLVLLPFGLKFWKKATRSEKSYLVLSGFLGSLLPAFLFAWAGVHINSALSGALNALTPLFTLLIGGLLFSIGIPWGKSIGLIVGFVGSLLLMFGQGGAAALEINPYTIPVVIATLCYGINLNIIRYKLSNVPSLSISSLSLAAVGGVGGIVLFSFTDFLAHLRQPGGTEAFWYILLLGVIGTGLALIFFNRLIKLSSALFASSVTYLIPIVALLWGVVDGETLTWIHFAGMAVVLLGVILTRKL